MVAPEGREYPPYPTLRAAESLVRSLVGVAGVSFRTGDDGALREIVVTPESGVSGRRVGLDILSAFKARFGLSLDPGAITVASASTETQKSGPPSAERPDSSVSAEPRVPSARNGTMQLNGHALTTVENGVRHPSAEPVADPGGGTRESSGRAGPAPCLVRADLEPVARGVRCRVTIAVAGEAFHGVAEAPAGFTAEAELAARVTLDALRSARTPRDPLQLRGVQLVDLAGVPHVVAALALWNGTDFDALAGAAPVRDSIADAAARAVLGSLNERI